MKIKIIKIIIVITIIICWFGRMGSALAVIKKSGNIEVITDEPLFADSIVWYPGLRIEKSFQVKNRGRGTKTVQIETENETESKQLAKALLVQIKEGNKAVFGVIDSKTLRNFFDSAAVSLGEVFGDDSGKTFSVAVTMPAGAGNEYQGGRAKFDLRIGFVGDSSSAVTVAEESTEVLGESGEKEEKEESPAFAKATASEEGLEREEESGISGESGGSGEVAGVTGERINWEFLAIIGGFLVSGGLAGWVWWKRSR